MFHGPCVLAWFRSRVGSRPARNAAASCPICRVRFSALPARLVLTVAYSLIRPSFQRARCCGCALTFQQPVNWQRNSKPSGHQPTQVRVNSANVLSQHSAITPPLTAAGCCADERSPDEQASASALLAQALADAGAAAAAAADAARANAALVRDRESLRTMLAAEREAARRARADAQAAEMRATTAEQQH